MLPQNTSGKKRKRNDSPGVEMIPNEGNSSKIKISYEKVLDPEILEENENTLQNKRGREPPQLHLNQPGPARDFVVDDGKNAGLASFFCGDTSIYGKKQEVENSDELGSTKAYFDNRSQIDEVKYVKELRPDYNLPSIPQQCCAEGELAFDPKSRYFQRIKTYEKYDFKSRKILTERLAVNQSKEAILKTIETNRFVIIDGFTGCGKTTQVPQYIMDYCFSQNKDCNIAVTQPRRIAARSVANRVSNERNWSTGSVVGYQVGRDKKTSPDTLITYVTTGVLLQKLISTQSLLEYTHIIIDEVHERDADSDMLLLVIKKILLDDTEMKYRYVKLILMSATLDSEKFSRYFPILVDEEDDEIRNVPIVRIPHTFRHRVEEYYLENLIENEEELHNIDMHLRESDKAVVLPHLYDVAVQTIVELDVQERKNNLDPRVREGRNPLLDRGSVLVFLPGIHEIETMNRALNEKNKATKEGYNWSIHRLHSSITEVEQITVFQRPDEKVRKIILSTNIAESSVTVPDIVYVIDFCLSKSLCIDHMTNFSTLQMVWASKSQCLQRKGRTGRVGSGKLYRLLPRKFYDEALADNIEPEMLRSQLEYVVLQLKKFDRGSPKELLALALDPPPLSSIQRAVAILKEVGGLTLMLTTKDGQEVYDTCDGNVTFLGEVMTALPIPPQCTKLIMLGHCFGFLKNAIVIAAALSVKDPFNSPLHKHLDSYVAKLNCGRRSYSDLFAVLFLYRHWNSKFRNPTDDRIKKEEREWAHGAYAGLSSLREIKSTVEMIEERLKQFRIQVRGNACMRKENAMEEVMISKEEGLFLKIMICGAFYPNYLYRRKPIEADYEKNCSKQVNGYDIHNTVFFKGFSSEFHRGELYAKHISNMLSTGPNIPCIKFHGSKIYAIFAPGEDPIGPVNRAVYRALKMRQLRQPCEFRITTAENEARLIKQWENRTIRMRENVNPVPDQIELPCVTSKEINVKIIYIHSPSHFFVIYEHFDERLKEMSKLIEEEVSLRRAPRLHRNKFQPNSFCLAPYSGTSLTQKSYYRAKIVWTERTSCNSQALVSFVDYGNTSIVPINELKDFSDAMKQKGIDQMPCYAIQCRLANIKPYICFGSSWHFMATAKLEEMLTHPHRLRMTITSVVNGIISGDVWAYLYLPDRCIEVSFVNYLVSKTFADYSEESHLSRLNQKFREIIPVDRDQIRDINEKQKVQPFDFNYMDPPPESMATSTVTLSGPFSPLEMEFQALCRTSSGKQVTVDKKSINSIILDHEPTSPTSRLMVAALIEIQNKTKNITARNTTIMPVVPGILSLMSLVFTPRMELRTDKRMTKYTGALCGLGPTPGSPDIPVYPDHDMEIPFDIVVTDKDIKLIDSLRQVLNVIIENSSDLKLSNYQKKANELMIELLKANREDMEEIWPSKEYTWNAIHPNMFIPCPDKLSKPIKNPIYNEHKTVDFKMLKRDDCLSIGYEV